MRNTKQRTSTYLLPVLYFPALQLSRVHELPSLIYPLSHDAQMLAPFVVQPVPVALTPFEQVHTFRAAQEQICSSRSRNENIRTLEVERFIVLCPLIVPNVFKR